MSVLAWARLPPGAPGHRALVRLVDQLACLRAVGLNPPAPKLSIPNGCANWLAKVAVYCPASPGTIAASPPRHSGGHRARHHRTTDRRRRRRRSIAPSAACSAEPRSREEEAVLRDARASTTRFACSPNWGRADRGKASRQGTWMGRLPSPWVGTGWRGSVAEAKLWPARTRRICRPSPCGPGRCCTGWGHCFSAPSSFAPSPRRQHVACRRTAWWRL